MKTFNAYTCLYNKTPIRCFNTKNLIQLQLDATSKGNQRKWFNPDENLYIKEQFYFQGKMWRDYLVEELSYRIWIQFKHDKNVEVLKQQRCEIFDYDHKSLGVYSKNFCYPDESFISFKRLLESTNKCYPYEADLATKWYFTLDLIQQVTDLDLTDYLVLMSILDYLLGNEDRHLNNFGILSTNTGYRLAPLFDFGLGLFEHDRKYEGEPLRKCLDLMQSQPFSKNNQDVIDFIRQTYNISEYLPKELDFSDCDIPTPKAGSYLRNRCKNLNLVVKGLD